MRTDEFHKLFLQFHGPTSILIQTRAVRLNDILSKEDANETAQTAPGVPTKTILQSSSTGEKSDNPKPQSTSTQKPLRMSLASIGKDGKVTITESDKNV